MNRAFSLLELLIVIAIMGLLAAMLMPVFASAKRAAESDACISNVHQLGLGILVYGGDYDDRLPYAPGPIAKTLTLQGIELDGDPYTELMKALPDLRVLLAPYSARPDVIWKCPSDQISPAVGEGRAPTWFQEAGSSYGYDEYDALSGQDLDSWSDPAGTLLMKDEEPFHGAGDLGDFQGAIFNCILFDGHVQHEATSQIHTIVSNHWWL